MRSDTVSAGSGSALAAAGSGASGGVMGGDGSPARRLAHCLPIPGPVDRTKLLSMATKIGVGESTRFLAKHKGTFARLAAPGGFTGERFLEKCAPTLGEPDALVEGLHVFTFNQVAETEAWRQDLLSRLG